MEKINDFIINNWTLLLIINGIAIVLIIIYLIEQKIKNKSPKKEKTKEKIIFDNSSNPSDEENIQDGKYVSDNNTLDEKEIVDENKNEIESDNLNSHATEETKIESSDIIEDQKPYTVEEEPNTDKNIDKDLEGIKEYTNEHNNESVMEDKEEFKEKIDKIVNDEKVFEEFDKIIPKKKIIDDKTKESLAISEKEENIFRETKKDIKIDTDIKLPEITLSTEEEDIWS